MPPKKGRGKGRGVPPGKPLERPVEDFPSLGESSRPNRGRGTLPGKPPEHPVDDFPSLAGSFRPNRGAGTPSGKPQEYPVEDFPSLGESSRPNRGRGNRGRSRGRGRNEGATSMYGAGEPHQKIHSHPIENPRVDEPTLKPSTSEPKEQAKGQKVDPENIGFKYLQISPNSSLFPKRPDVGKVGRHIRVVSNCYPINFPSGYVYHYDVDVIDANQRKATDAANKKYRCLNTKRSREVIVFMLKHDPNFKGVYGAFDGKKNLLTKKELKINLPFSCTVVLPSDSSGKQSNPQDEKYDSFKVEINALVSRISLDSIRAFYDKKCNDLPQEAIMAVETILRHDPCLTFTPIGRSFFYPPDIGNVTPFGGGLEIWFGYHQSIRLSQWKPTVNLNSSATTFWKGGPVIDFIAECMNRDVRDLPRLQLNRSDVRMLTKKLKQKQIKVTHLSYGRKWRVVKLRERSANQERLMENGVETNKTVVQYFKETYKKNLVYANLPCLQVQPENKNIFLPVEFCEIVPGQHYKGEITAAQKATMIKFTSNNPYEKFKKIDDIFFKANFNRNETVKGFGLEVSNRPVVADARVLNPPNLVYKDRNQSEKPILPHDGSWNVRETKFFQAAKISKWALVSFQENRNLGAFANVLVRIGRNLGLQIFEPSEISVIRNTYCDKEKLFKDLKDKGNNLVVVVIPTCDEREEKRIYAEVKKAAETGIGLTTQCLKAERLRDMGGNRGPQIASNLCLKINAKLGGENHSLFERDIPSIMCKPVIIIGADVNHPAPTQLDQPSIAACVGSLDSFGKRFAVSIRAQVNSNPQKKKVEHICDLQDMVRDLLIAFNRHTKQKPEKIIFYRDGVSEGELVTVKNEEIVSIRKACRSLEKDYEPGITTIVVQKRHHVRFRPEDRREGVGRMNNIPPGTVIDTEITHPVNFDFFLCSQFGLQGTSRPSHYLVVEDDNNFSADELQKLTFHLCHMYVRCTKSISIPAPVAYADLVAYRARKHLACKKGDDYDSNSDSSRNYGLTAEDIDAIKVTENLKDSMYFV